MDELGGAIARIDDDGVRATLAHEARAAFARHWREDVVIGQYLDLIRDAAHARGDMRVVSAVGALTT